MTTVPSIDTAEGCSIALFMALERTYSVEMFEWLYGIKIPTKFRTNEGLISYFTSRKEELLASYGDPGDECNG